MKNTGARPRNLTAAMKRARGSSRGVTLRRYESGRPLRTQSNCPAGKRRSEAMRLRSTKRLVPTRNPAFSCCPSRVHDWTSSQIIAFTDSLTGNAGSVANEARAV